MNVVISAPVTKEGKRLEGSLGRSMEKVVKANSDALWARIQEENVKQEKFERDHVQQITNLISNYINKDMTSQLEKVIKKEISSIGTTITRSISQIIEKTISSAFTESFQVYTNFNFKFQHLKCYCSNRVHKFLVTWYFFNLVWQIPNLHGAIT